MTTGVVDFDSDLVRKKWMREGLLQAKAKSFWATYTGVSKESILMQSNNKNASEGHTVVFDMRGNLSGKAKKGKETAFGTGEQKKKFSDKLIVERYRLVVDNGDAFDGINIGDLSITQHGDSREGLSDLFIRWKDQMIFDTGQSVGGAPTHIITPGTNGVVTNTWYRELVDIEIALRTGVGMFSSQFNTSAVVAQQRAPLAPYKLKNGRSMWLMVVDPATAGQMRKDTSMVGILQQADNRGSDNMLIAGLIAKMGALHIVEAEAFFGSNSTGLDFNDTEVEICGLRQYDISNSAWSGEDDFDATGGTLWSRNLILGKGALQLAFGKMPDYKWKESQDFGIKSESAVEFYTHCQKINLKAENEDYKAAKRANLDNGIVVVDVQTKA